jgi:putative PIN family toxin of toxin-antitoxin system
MKIRAYLDTNLYISYLLNPMSPTPPSTIVRVGLRGAFTILFGDPTVDEILRKTATKPYLSGHIPKADVSLLLEILATEGEMVRPFPTVIPSISRDRKDDYLVTYAQAGNATHLVTGDHDLRNLPPGFRFDVVTPAGFVRIIEGDEPSS